jgi:membrane-associated HD superfamily phosphohydrolase
MSKDLDQKVDQLEAAMDPNTVISVGGYNFTPAKLMIAGAIVSSTLGGLYGVFEVYKDYMSMKEAISTYVAPDLSAINERLSVIQKQTEAAKDSADQTVAYTNEIKNDLKSDIRRLESVVEAVERSSKQNQRETDQTVKEVTRAVDQTVKEVTRAVDQTVKEVTRAVTQLERESQQNLRTVRQEVDDKIKKALDNPLAN